jgi:mannose-6-phosphate isomerase-like protein (cupin superfamily)
MNAELAIAALGCFVLAFGHTTIGLRWVLPNLTKGPGGMTTRMAGRPTPSPRRYTMESTPFAEALLPTRHDAIAPDGSQVRLLVRLPGGSMAHFELDPGEVSRPTQHRTVSEAWYILQGLGRMWRRQDGTEREIDLRPGTALTIPVGTAFQFRNTGHEPLAAVGLTMPPWPGEDEAMDVAGPWVPQLTT